MTVLAPGTPAPEFKLAREDGERSPSRTCTGTTRCFVFYPFAFSPVCTDQLQLYEGALAGFAERGVHALRRLLRRQLVAEGVPREARRLQRAAVGLRAQGRDLRGLGVLHAGGFAERALVIVDQQGVVRWSYQARSPGELPALKLLREGVNGVLEGDPASA